MTSQTVLFLLPEIALVAVATLILVGGAFVQSRGNWSWLAGAGLAAAGLLLAEGRPSDVSAVVEADGLGQFIRWLAIVVGLLLVLLSARMAAAAQAAEIMGSLLLLLSGLMISAVSQDLIMLFLGLELISIPTYVLLSLARAEPNSQEVSTKYLLLSILSSALLLYGFSFLYGVGGSTDLALIAGKLSADDSLRPLAVLALVLVFAGFGFRLAAAPFHFYAPDVYEGTNHACAALLSIVPKLAALVGLVRVTLTAMPGLASYGWGVALMLSLVSMTLGNTLALWQDNVRRMMAYSSIAHGGYVLMGLTVAFAASGGAQAAPTFDGAAAALFYLTVYAVATAGAFAALAYLRTGKQEIDSVEQLAGAGRTAPLASAALAIFMFSLAGIPPLAGFWGKFTLFTGVMGVRNGALAQPLESWFLALAVVGVLNAAIGAAYYLRVIAVLFFKPASAADHGRGGAGALLAALLAAVATVWLGLFPGPLVETASRAVVDRQGTQAPEVTAATHQPAASLAHADAR